MGRGGAGPGQFVYALLNRHSSTIKESGEQQQWDAFSDANLANDPQRSTLRQFMQQVKSEKPAEWSSNYVLASHAAI